MTLVDAGIVVFAVLMATVGFRQGFVVGVLSLVGFGLGALAGTRLGPLVLKDGSSSPYAPMFGLLGALLGGGILSTGLEGLGLGLRRRLRIPGLATVDGLLGALLSATLALAIVWVAGAVALQAPGAASLRQDIQRSFILRKLNAALPPSGPLLNALARFDPFPTLSGPPVDVRPPEAAVARLPAVRAAGGSVVKITGTACGLGVEGSGWIAADGLVVTNAHVVAGESDTQVQVGGSGPEYDASAVAFNSHDDVAVLRVPDLVGAPSLPFATDTSSGVSGAILGFPHDGGFDVRAARLGSTSVVITDDAYGRGPVPRPATAVRGIVRPGNSGGPVVDTHGRVLATIFARVSGTGPRAGYAVPNRLVEKALAAVSGSVSTGSCAE